MPNPLHLASLALALTSLAGCEHKSPATSPPTTAQPVAVQPDTTFLVSGLPQDSIIPPEPIAAIPSDVVPVITKSKLVALNLAVTISGTYATDNEQVNPKRILLIKQHSQVIYTDTTADFLYEEPFKSSIYPLWVPTGRGSGELLIEVQSPLDLGLARRFFIKNGHVIKTDTLPVFEEKARNLDEDPRSELGGYRYSGEQWDDGKGHYFTSYNPKLYYEIRPTGLLLDTALTKRRAIEQFGVFRGFAYSEKPGIRIKKPE
jgi:hypothetical protein